MFAGAGQSTHGVRYWWISIMTWQTTRSSKLAAGVWISSRQTSGWSFDQMHLTYDISWVLLLWLSWGLLVQRMHADQFQMSQGHHVKTVKMYWEIIWIQELIILKFCSVGLYTSPCVIRTHYIYVNLKYRSNIYTHSKSKILAASSKRCG